MRQPCSLDFLHGTMTSKETISQVKEAFSGSDETQVEMLVYRKDGNECFLASYEISKIIVKAGKPHNIGKTVILPAVSAIISSVVKQNAIEITNSIPLSNSSVSRRIDEMVEDVEKQLIAHLQVKQFALQLDESTLRDNEAPFISIC
ncbi:hypothetical protein QYM36_019385 [Artemia franciscana]|uniref:Uncharacterized protein n=1 Tax=Artemia franciscana TaxID=6661 RepID=A0AA88KR05_ARTSF|nr:hypothetical protein QYM36_019385 [Artemia franciscana]